MRFDQLRPGDHVRYARTLVDNALQFPDAASWEGEPYNCLLEVVRASGHSVELACTEGCGGHHITNLTREEYNEYSSILEDHLLQQSSISEFLNNESPEVEEEAEYSVEDEVEYILKLLQRQCKETTGRV